MDPTCKAECFPDVARNQAFLGDFPTPVCESVNAEMSPLAHTVHHMQRWLCLFVVSECAAVHNELRAQRRMEAQRREGRKRACCSRREYRSGELWASNRCARRGGGDSDGWRPSGPVAHSVIKAEPMAAVAKRCDQPHAWPSRRRRRDSGGWQQMCGGVAAAAVGDAVGVDVAAGAGGCEERGPGGGLQRPRGGGSRCGHGG